MNKSTIDRLLHNYQKYDLTDCRIDYEVIEKIASEFSILQQKVNQLETNIEEDKEIGYLLISTENNKYLVEKINELIKAVNELKKGK